VIELWIALGAAVGAPARYLGDRAVQTRFTCPIPLGTLCVNLVAAFVLGIMEGVGSSASVGLIALISVGFCGSLSTFSTFSFETMRLTDARQWRAALGYVTVSVLAGCALAALGWWLA
jgi:CrcB protein